MFFLSSFSSTKDPVQDYPHIVIYCVGDGHGYGALDEVHGQALVPPAVHTLTPAKDTKLTIPPTQTN